MWHAPNQRLRSLNSAKKKERERARRPIHIKRISALLEMANPGQDDFKTNIRLILNDLSYKGAGLFSSHSYVSGQEVSINISEPTQIVIRAKILWCQEYHADSHVLSKQPFAFRMGVEFMMDPTEEKLIKEFCDDVSKNHLFIL